MTVTPVETIPPDDESGKPEAGMALCLYAVCDAALRKHLDAGLQPEPAFPYPKSGV
jgi:hypothetical protein